MKKTIIKLVNLDEKCIGKTTALTIFSKNNQIKLLNHGTILTAELIRDLKKHGISNVFI